MASTSQNLLNFVAELIKKRLAGSGDAVFLRPRENSNILPSVGRARYRLESKGTTGYSQWLASSTRVLFADVTLAILQTKMLKKTIRTHELLSLVSEIVRIAPELNILEVFNSETSENALFEARECPFRRVEEIKRAAPGMVLRASLSAASAFGKNVLSPKTWATVVDELSDAGIDIFRIADPYNDINRLSMSVAASVSNNRVIEGTISVNGSFQTSQLQSSIDKSVEACQMFEQNGVRTIVVEDLCGTLRPVGIYSLIRAIRRNVCIPVWAHVVDMNGYGLATCIAAIEAGVCGVDTVVPSLFGPGLEPDCIALATALSDTERKPEIDIFSLLSIDEYVQQISHSLGGIRVSKRPPPDLPDRGVSLLVLEEVIRRCKHQETISNDHALAACEAASNVLENPAMIQPAIAAVTELATQILIQNESGGSLVDKARVDDPQGILDTIGVLREGGFSEKTDEVQSVTSRDDMLRCAYGDQIDEYLEIKSSFGTIELIPNYFYENGLGEGEHCEFCFDGLPITVRVKSIQQNTAKVEIHNELYEIAID